MSTATSSSKAAAFAALILAAAAAGAQPLATVDLGRVIDHNPVSRTLTIRNPSPRKVARLDLLSACATLSVRPQGLLLDPRASATVTISYYAGGTLGKVEHSLLVKSTLPELDDRRVLVAAHVEVGPAPSECDECRKLETLVDEERLLQDYARRVVLVDFYGDLRCASCREYLDRELPRTAFGSRWILRLAEHSVADKQTLEQLMRRLEGAGASLEVFPLAFVGDRPYQGLVEIRKALEATLAAGAAPPAAPARLTP